MNDTPAQTNHPRSFSENLEFSLTEDDFESEQNSTILVREGTKAAKLEGAYTKKEGMLLEQSNQTITFLPAGRSQATIISKRRRTTERTMLFTMETTNNARTQENDRTRRNGNKRQ